MSAIGHTMASMTRGGKADMAGSTSTPRYNSNGRVGSNNGRLGSNNNNALQVNRDRGQNISHLMSFSLPPRLAPPTAQNIARRSRRGGGQSIPFNKERYVNAQYRFLVKPTEDYTAYFADSDIYLNWADILTVLIPTSSALSTASHITSHSSQYQPDLERHEGATCPICLSPPTAPRMTKCGHVFCYPCILHYLIINESASTSGSSTPNAYHQHVPGASRSNQFARAAAASSTPKWKRCPICWDAVYAKDLKAVQWWDAKAHAKEHLRIEGMETPNQKKEDYLCMQLIERPHLTTLALPQSSTWPNASTTSSDLPLIAQHSAPWHFQPDVMTFCKFMLATPDQLLRNLNSNLNDLREERHLLQSYTVTDEVGIYFVDMAERKVQEQMEKVMNELDTKSVQSRIGFAKNELKEHEEIVRGIKLRDEEAISRRERKRREKERKTDTIDGIEGQAVNQESVADFLNVQSERQSIINFAERESSSDNVEIEASQALRRDSKSHGVKSRRNLNPPAPSSSSYLFYQASSGQNIFLHPLDIKVLLSIYSTYSAFPRTLQIPIQGADEGSMNEEIKKKCKYLAHLTKGTDIVFIEIDWDALIKEDCAVDAAIQVKGETIKMYEHALKQRRFRRRDRERRDDRAKAKWEETEKANRSLRDGRGRSIERMQQSPKLSTGEEPFSRSFGSASTTSPTFRQAALTGAELDFARLSGVTSAEDDFPATIAEQVQIGRVPSAANPSMNPSNTMRRTVWGTPAAPSGTFATTLHNSSRRSDALEEVGPDWDAWLELEEDFIVGARNGNSVKEGRGLNRQMKKSASAVDSSSEGAKAENSAYISDSKPTTQKQQKKKKLILTSGGLGRGR